MTGDGQPRGIVVEARPGESTESLLARFTREVRRDGVLADAKRRMHFESTHDQARRRELQRRRNAKRKQGKRDSRRTAAMMRRKRGEDA